MNHQNDLSRRGFLRTAAAAAAAAGWGSSAFAADKDSRKPTLPYGMLGKTKYPTTLISFGAIKIAERTGTRVVKAGIDAGMNLLHTSATYGRGASVQAIGELFKAAPQYREKIFLCLKSFTPDKEEELTGMLKTLHADHADLLLSTMDKADPARLEVIQKGQDKLKAKGLIRHTGFVCHGDMNEVVEMVLDKAPDYFDATLLAMRMVPVPGGHPADEAGKRFVENLKKLREKKVGIISMKSGAQAAVRKGTDVFQPHAKAILEAGADTVLTTFDAFSQVDLVKELKLSSPFTPAEKKAAAEFYEKNAGACRMCAECTKACPQGLPVSDLMRVRMYHDEYGWPEHARNEFALLGPSAARALGACGDCTACSQVCPVQLAGSFNVQRIATLMA